MFKKSIFLAFSMCLPCFGQWHGDAWTKLRLAASSQVPASVWATSHSLIVTNYVGTNEVLTTNSFIGNVHFQKWTTAPVSGVWTIYRTSNNVSEAVSYSYTNMPILTNVTLQSRELLAMDSFNAILERIRAISSEAETTNGIAAFPPVYRNEREALVWVKDWLKANYTNRWIDATKANASKLYTDYFKTNSTLPVYGSVTNFLGTNIPPNYLDETPWRELHPTDVGYYRSQTCLVYIAGIDTQTVMDCCGAGTITVSSSTTNGAYFTNSCVHSSLWASAGSNWYATPSGEWGWRHITNLFAKLVHITANPCVGATSYQKMEQVYYELDNGPGCTSLAEAVNAIAGAWADAVNYDCTGAYPFVNATYQWGEDTSCGFPYGGKWYSKGWISSNAPVRYIAGAHNSAAKLAYGIGAASTGITHLAQLYVSCPTNAPSGYVDSTNVVFTYFDYGLGLTTNKSVFAEVTSIGPTNATIQFGDAYDPTGPTPDDRLDLPDESDAPAVVGQGTVKGYGDVDMLWVIRWDVTDGFRYK